MRLWRVGPRPLLLAPHPLILGLCLALVEAAAGGGTYELIYNDWLEDTGRHRGTKKTSPSFGAGSCLMPEAAAAVLPLDECVASRGAVVPPYQQVRAGGGAPAERQGPRDGEAQAGYMLLTWGTAFRFMLWSRCGAGCGDCRNGTGRVLLISELNLCFSVHEQGTALLRRHSSGVDTWSQASFAVVMSLLATVSVVLITLAVALCKWTTTFLRRWARIERSAPITRVSGLPTCVVCLEAVEGDQWGRTLQCAHSFHAECIDTWWSRVPCGKLNCPTCRAPHLTGDVSGRLAWWYGLRLARRLPIFRRWGLSLA